MKTRTLPLSLVLTFSWFLAGGLHAAWLEVDDFNAIAFGPLNGHGGWTASSSVDVEDDGHGNRVASFRNIMPDGSPSDSKRFYKSATVPGGTTATLFFRITAVGDVVRHYFGMTDKASPSDAMDLALCVRATTHGDPDDGKYTLNMSEDGSFGSSLTADVDTWYNVWMVIRLSSSDRYNGYINSGYGSATWNDLQVSNAPLNYAAGGDLTKVLGVVEAQSPDWQVTNVWIDDIYIDTSGENFENPVIPEPALLFIPVLSLFLARGSCRAWEPHRGPAPE